MKTNIIHIAETDSTNRWLKDYHQEDDADITVVVVDSQTAGRGQGNNTWESEPGKNLTFSILIHPVRVPVGRQFLLSMMEAIAMKMALATYVEDEITLKWPNDLYWKDKKIGGTLIETTLSQGHIKDCIFGTGIDVNQKVFQSDAPNPMSLCEIVGHDIDLDELLQRIVKSFETCYDLLLKGGYNDVSALYHDALYRKHGFFRYRDADGEFEAAVVEVEDDGHLILRDRQGVIREYMFKEVQFLLD